MNKILETLLEEKKIKLKGSLYHLTQINFSYNSNHIEGSQLTEEQTQYIYETNSFISNKEKVVSIDDINETINHFKCFDYILENVGILDENLIKNSTSKEDRFFYNELYNLSLQLKQQKVIMEEKY